MGWTLGDAPLQAGKFAIVTGGTGGLGFEVVAALAKAGAEVIIASRDVGKGRAALDRLQGLAPRDTVRFEPLDLARLDSVEAFADRMLGQGRPIDVLVNNAGVMAPPKRQLTVDGFELQFGINYLGHFALTGRLLPLLRRAITPRVVSVSSLGHKMGPLDLADLTRERYDPWKAYGQSKLAMIAFTHELQRRSDAAGWGLRAVAAHPGWSATDLVKPRGGERVGLMVRVMDAVTPLMAQSAAQGALPLLFAALDSAATPGGYYGPDGPAEARGSPRPATLAPFASDAAVEAELWERSTALTHVAFG